MKNNPQNIRRRILRLENIRRHMIERGVRAQRMYMRCKGDTVRLRDFCDNYRSIMANMAYKINNLRVQLDYSH